MRLANYTDYTLRVLMYCAQHRERRVTIAELAQSHSLSKNHLMKIVNDLARHGLLETARGRGGGVRLLLEPAEIGVGAVVRWCESDFRMVECFDENSNTCRLSPACRLKKLFQRALASWLRELDTATLADLVGDGAAESLGASAIISLSRRAPAAAALARG
ncbi:MAG: Rrf2 family transcriptional regulator [Giesbergeria sp.]|jgi:Rrf2 family nitric oxide-sensitive transcriptional repressor|nr:Rrf2 family transcriptional regulator [Simplicispira sp.]MBP6118953.1 Rrf2 family transcriptional regulator [Giesbergeria sp.]MBP6159225.1 Rrf2 family transcriptional regulator [Giesbergeria sp.]MBP7083327.1 Rrf2 family transcriptional regulator [Giesbergeria sp.]MBP9783630.1 Rrf2 family transcriptional regulator [Giesbergeria sp.]